MPPKDLSTQSYEFEDKRKFEKKGEGSHSFLKQQIGSVAAES